MVDIPADALIALATEIANASASDPPYSEAGKLRLTGDSSYWANFRANAMAASAPFSARTFLTWARWAAESGRMALM